MVKKVKDRGYLNVLLLGLTSFFTDVSTEMVYPVVPLFLVSQLGATPAVVGLIEGLAESTASLLKVFSGAISDRLGKRKPLTIFGYSFSLLGKIFIYLASGWWLVGLGRFIDRFGKGVRTAPRDALIADGVDHKKRGKAYGLHRTMDTAGALTGVLLAYLILKSYKNGYQPVILASIIPAFLGVLVLFLVQESKSHQKETHPGEKLKINWKSFLRLDRRLKAFLLISALFTLGNSSNQFLLLRAQNLNFSVANVLLLYLFFNLSYALFSYPAGHLSDKIGRKKIIVFGYFFYSLVYLGFALAPSSIWIIALFFLYGIYMGLTEGVEKALVTDLAPAVRRATLLGFHATLIGLGLFPASFIAGLLWNLISPAAPFYFGSLTGFLAALLFLIFI